ncbi:MAG: hypothetical protein KF688_17480 [Pirellulales bacterium]|nr:hypothetical protein [Pirellulales bacterium]
MTLRLDSSDPDLILSVPPHMCVSLAACEPGVAQRAVAVFDPPDSQLGSGGGTAFALHEAWRRSGIGSFREWLEAKRRLVIHGGGESRRLPAYAPAGKLFLPMPALRWARGQRLGQTLLELNEPFLRQALEQCGPRARVLVASGDVLLRCESSLPRLPEADVVILGMWASPEEAQRYGVLFVDPREPQRLVTFLQKPSPDEIRERSRDAAFLIDVGAWLLSERAVTCLLAKCGWDARREAFAGEVPASYDLYGQWALSLGEKPADADAEIAALSVAVVPVRDGQFYHFGTTADLVESAYQLQNVVRDQTSLGAVSSLAQPRQFIQDSEFGSPVRLEHNHSLWVENSYLPASWTLASRHVITGVPRNDWRLELPAGACLDFVPLGEDRWGLRCYGYADAFRGAVGDPATMWFERPAAEWFQRRGISLPEAGIEPTHDFQLAPLFPVATREQLTAEFVAWTIAEEPRKDTKARAAWLAAPRASARELAQNANLERLYSQRLELRRRVLPTMIRHGAKSVFYKLDLAHTARTMADSSTPLPTDSVGDGDLMQAIGHRMFHAEVRRLRGDEAWRDDESRAFALLREAIVEPYRQRPVQPEFRLADDQIVWGRSPVRIDLAGGWTDTPPYCLQHGGSVVNAAVELNGQAPIQAFARRCSERTLTIRSIDLGLSETLTTYDDVGSYGGIGSGFAVAKAAFAICGFHPQFNGGRYGSLAEQLERFGGGIDLSMLSAVPKGSGLGASSILSATVLGTLGDLCGHGWDVQEIAARVSAIEQMLGSGGGWQDQFGGLVAGAKLVESQPGIGQRTVVRHLPGEFFATADYQSRALLYYTGITRVAHDVLSEIVRGMFLNDQDRLATIDAIGRNSRDCFDAVQRGDLPAYGASIDRSWRLNQALDDGTNPPAVAELVARIAPHAAALKLAGAGGGGFLYILCRTADAARTLRRELEGDPPNSRARFFDMTVSPSGFRVTRS